MPAENLPARIILERTMAEKLIVLNSKEKDDIQEGLPSEWTKPEDIGEATIYNMAMSPPCCKIRTIFSWYKVKHFPSFASLRAMIVDTQVPYKVINGKKPDSEYKKVPVVVVKNRQINDSYIVVKVLARILDGTDLTKEQVQIEEMTTYGLMIALEADVAGSCTDLVKCAPHMGCFYCCLLTSLSCCICCIGPANIRKRNPDTKSIEHYSQAYTAALGSKQYFHGDKPGIVDVSICGVLSPFVNAKSGAVDKFLGASGPLRDWYGRMSPSLPSIF